MDCWKELTTQEIDNIKTQVREYIQLICYLKIKTIDVELQFINADLNPSNIIIKNKKVNGIVDWEFSGYYNKESISKTHMEMSTHQELWFHSWGDLYNI